jgi:hypothetical protein
MVKPEFKGEQELQTVEIVQRIDGQGISIVQRLEVRRNELSHEVGHVAMPPRDSSRGHRDGYTPSDDFDMLHYMGRDSDRESRIASAPRNPTPTGMTDNFSHDFDAPWYQGRI